jgi:hypothetical protein
MKKRSSIDAFAAVVAWAVVASSPVALTQEGAPAQKPDAAPKAELIEPDAMAAINAMGTFLRTLGAFSVTAETTIDEVTDAGEKLQFGGNVELQAQRPDKLRAEVDSDRKQRQLIYDGKTFSVYGPRVGYYATVAAPATIRDLLDLAERRYDIHFPLADLFRWGTDEAAAAEIREAAIIGPAKIDNVVCDHVAVREKDIDWQVWIERGKTPLPRKLVITTKGEPEQPQYSVVMHWNVNPKFDAGTFAFVPPKGANRIPLRGTDAASGSK